ncbi:hypothetical protein MPLSOD_40815 [Mesorhizobium sp. SOD10]|nr:hypothetical protein MPLSOD_40815 [Mesorhizobium sp. SOD10]
MIQPRRDRRTATGRTSVKDSLRVTGSLGGTGSLEGTRSLRGLRRLTTSSSTSPTCPSSRIHDVRGKAAEPPPIAPADMPKQVQRPRS